METLKDISKAIKPLGFKIKMERMSWGKLATYIHIESGLENSSNIFTPELLAIWQPLLEWKVNNRLALQRISEKEKVFCLG